MKRKCLTIGIILLFIGVAIAPSINFTVVKASSQTVESSNQLPIVEQYQMNDQVLQKEITESSNSESECGCENENTTPGDFTIICTLLFPIFMYFLALWFIDHTIPFVFLIGDIGKALNCWWEALTP